MTSHIEKEKEGEWKQGAPLSGFLNHLHNKWTERCAVFQIQRYKFMSSCHPLNKNFQNTYRSPVPIPSTKRRHIMIFKNHYRELNSFFVLKSAHLGF